MGNKSSQTSTSRQTTKPDAFTDQWRNQLFAMGSSMMKQPTPNQQIAPMSDMTQAGLGGMGGYAQGGIQGLDQAYAANNQQMTGFNPAMPFAANVANGQLSNNPWGASLNQYGSGENPHLRSLFDAGANQVADAVNARFAGAGRYGGNAAHTGAMTRELGNLWSNIAMPAYEAERNRGLQATQAGASLYESGANRQLAGGAMMGDLWNTGMDQANRAIGNVPGLFAAGAMPFELMSQVGGAYDAQNQAQLDATYQNQNAPWQRYLEYAAAMQGMPIFGTTTGSNTQKNNSTGIGWSWSNGLTLGG